MDRTKFRVLIGCALMVLLLVGGVVMAQDDSGSDGSGSDGSGSDESSTEETAATESSTDASASLSAPEIISIEPTEITIEGRGFDIVTVTYDDVDQDAIRFVWSSENEDLFLPAGSFNQVYTGTEIAVPFYCYGRDEISAEITLEVVDNAGLVSESASFTLNCVVPEPPAPPAGETPEPPATVGSAPVIEAITPEEALIDGPGETVVTVVYSDDDSDARAFVWSMGNNNMRDFELPPGFFQQEVIGNEIPVTFFCTRPDFFAEIFLLVIDAEGNISDPASFTLLCD